MNSKNNFTEETKKLFIWNTKCFFCSKEHANCFHHTLGRVSNSPLNLCPINNFDCHIGNGKLSHTATIKKLLHRTLEYLLRSDYQLTEEDREFMKEHEEYYQDFKV